MNGHVSIVYFSMEIAIEPGMPTYCGGLGILAGDTLRSAADLKVPMVAVTLLHRKGYFRQRLDECGWQHEEAAEWRAEDFLKEMQPRVTLELFDRILDVEDGMIRACINHPNSTPTPTS